MSESINSNNTANYGKFVVDNSSDTGEGRTEVVDLNKSVNGNEFGQLKYAKRGAANSIYRDPTRETDNDKLAVERMKEPSCEAGEAESYGDGRRGND